MEMGLVELEALAVIAVEEGRDPKMPLMRMLSLSLQDEVSARIYLESMDRLAPILPTDEQYWEARLGMARAAQYLKDQDYVDQLYGELVAMDPSLETAPGRMAYYHHARAMFERGEQEAAIERYRQLWDLSAQYSTEEFDTFGTQLASAYGMMEDWENVVEVAPAVIGPLDEVNNYMLALTLAKANERLERFGEAAKLYQRLYNVRKRIDAEKPGHDLHRLGEALDARNMELRWQWAAGKHEGQQHRLAAAETPDEPIRDLPDGKSLDRERSTLADFGDRAESEKAETKDSEVVEDVTTTGTATPYWWVLATGLALISVVLAVKLAR